MYKNLKIFKNPLLFCFVLFTCLCGGFHPFVSAFASVFLLVYFVILTHKNNGADIKLNVYFITFAVISLFYLVSVFWAVDKFSAVLGFFKFLPIPLFLLCGMQVDGAELKEQIIKTIPLLGIFMTVISAVFTQIPVLSDYFSVAGRISGFFEYSNTFSLFLLLGIIIVGWDKGNFLLQIAEISVLLFGIVYSGTRTVIVMLFPVVILLLIRQKNRKFTFVVAGVIIVLFGAAAGYGIIKGDFSVFGRFMKISLKSSTLLGRLLYNKDALRVAIKHPFGLGFLGFYYIEQTVQTGVYAVQFVHNDWLQIILDVGFIPFALLLFSFIKFMFSKNINGLYKAIIGTLAFHCLFDFDFQFVSVFLLFSVLLPFESGKAVRIKQNMPVSFISVIVALFGVYFGIIDALWLFKCYELSDKISFIPNTEAQISMLEIEEDVSAANEIADKILSHNGYIEGAYRAKAFYYYSSGDFGEMIANKEKAIEYAPYNAEEYEEYAYMLLVGRKLYLENGDSESADFCTERLLSIEDKLNAVKLKTDKLAFEIKDKPVFELSEETQKEIKTIKNEKG